MVKGEFDMPKLLRSLKKASKGFGDTNKTAIARWGVQSSREMAVSSQAFGRSGTRKKQINSIDAGINTTIAEVSDKQFEMLRTKGGVRINGRWVVVTAERMLASADECHKWINSNRGSHGRTRKLSPQEKAVASKTTLRAVRRERHALAGIAKEGWLDAGQAIATKQKGANKINIGRNFLGYAQRSAVRGSAKTSVDPFNPVATLRNHMRHSSSPHVLRDSEIKKAVGFGLRKTLTWYRRAAKQALDK